ncbi:MFS transporter [Actinomadura barringtoniae]|uniref:MFS transporter n=1 Tax=Actinomadura barringtoniae TaxID=1427535 RepID=A0A939PFW0_9ACTN|nr:MFS transporter [Actinomadura barringtoniae]MBO2448979.1 MFS transporter [Actinomadura barringtoniae]
MTVPPRAGRREWIALAVLALPALLVSLDLFVMVMALPRLSAELGAGSTQQLWIMDVYGFMVAGLLITMGTLGDRIGRRRLLLLGAAAFGTASVLAAFSTTPEMLIAARALLGVAGAALTPSTLAMIMTLFHDPRQRASAVGIWAGCFTLGAIVGPLVGGVMLEHFWWGSVFLLGVPAMAALLVLGPLLLPEHRDTSAGRLDLPSVVLSLGAILSFIYGLKETARNGWHPLPVAALAAGLALGAVFVARQRRLADPLLDLSLFRRRAFSIVLVGLLANAMLSGGTMNLVAQHLQLVDRLSPLNAGLAMVPGMIAAMVSFQVAPLLGRRIPPVPLIPLGLALTVTGMLIIAQADGTGGLVAGFAVSCLGAGPLVSIGTNVVVGAAPPAQAGSAAAIAQTGNELGYALGIAVLGSLGTAVYRHTAGGPAAGPGPAHDSLAGAADVAARLPQHAGAAVMDAARHAFTTELQVVSAVCAAVMLGLAVLIAAALRDLPAVGRQTEAPAPTPVPEAEAEAATFVAQGEVA